MEIRITKLRVAMAALFVLAGVGLASLLSPLVGSALAKRRPGREHLRPLVLGFLCEVTSAGELKTNGVVSDKVAPALPPQPFTVVRNVTTSSGAIVLGPTTATVALTDVTFANSFGNGPRELLLDQHSAAAPNAGCTGAHFYPVGLYDAPTGQTVVQDFATPIVLKPLASGETWCLIADMSAPAGEVDRVSHVTLGGYVLSGTFTPPTAPAPAKMGRTMRER